MSAVGRCDLGRVRSQNEDSIYISENPNTEFEYYKTNKSTNIRNYKC